MKFIDEILIRARSGHGGAGLCSFRSAKNAPKLGADGGDGGFGGHVLFKGNSTLNTLSHLYYMKVYAAGDGERGGPNGGTEPMVVTALLRCQLAQLFLTPTLTKSCVKC